MANSTRTSQLNIVQGDKSPIAFQLLDRRQQPITSINGQIAEISIFESKGMVLREFSEARVDDGVFTFHLEQVLNTGSHEMRVKVGDYYFPSDTGTFTFNILPAHDITTEVDPTDVKTIDLVIDALADEIVDYFYPVLEETTHEYFVQNAPVFKGEAFTYEDFTPEQLTELSMKVATESKDEDGNTIVTFSDGSTVTISKGDKGDKGDQGEQGDPLKFADLTPEQREELQQEVDYSQVAQKDHTHELSEVNGLSTKLDAKANSTDHEALEQRIDDIADEEGNINAGTIPMAHDAGSASEATIKDSIYKLEDDLNTHTHTAEEIEGLSEKIADLSNAAPAVHTHAIEEVSGLRVELDSKASTTDVDDIATELDSKAEVNHTHIDKADIVHTHTTADIAGLDTKLSELENNTGGIPAEHTHDMADVTGLQGALNAKSNDGHTHNINDLLDTGSNGEPFSFNWKVYRDSITQSKNKLASLDSREILLRNDAASFGNVYDALEKKALKTHTHKASDINYQWSHAVTKTVQEQLDELRSLRGDVQHTHEISEVNGLVVELFNKADKEHTHNISDVTSLQTTLDAKADKEHSHDNEYAKKNHSHWVNNDEQYDLRIKLDNAGSNTIGNSKALIPYIRENVLGDKADVDHTHEMSNINGLTTELDNLKSSGVDAKTAISSAINSKGGSTTNTDTFDVMAQAISGLSSGGSGGNIKILPIAHDFENILDFKVVGLDFAPDEFFIIGNTRGARSADSYGASTINQMSTMFKGNAYTELNTWIYGTKEPVSSGYVYMDGGTRKSTTLREDSSFKWNQDGVEFRFNYNTSYPYPKYLKGFMVIYKKDKISINSYLSDFSRIETINENYNYTIDASLL